jgi:YlmC/YmxH family sporulation protein
VLLHYSELTWRGVDPLRYSELIGKEIVDLSEGIRLGAVIGSDLIIDTERGTLEALVIYQRRGLLGSHEIKLAWSGIRSMGRDLILVDMIDADISSVDRSQAYVPQRPLRIPTQYLPVGEVETQSTSPSGRESSRTDGSRYESRPTKHRVAGIDKPPEAPVVEAANALSALELEEESPQEILGRIARGAEREQTSIWQRIKRKEKNMPVSE